MLLLLFIIILLQSLTHSLTRWKGPDAASLTYAASKGIDLRASWSADIEDASPSEEMDDDEGNPSETVNFTPLAMALHFGNFEAAEALILHGAKDHPVLGTAGGHTQRQLLSCVFEKSKFADVLERSKTCRGGGNDTDSADTDTVEKFKALFLTEKEDKDESSDEEEDQDEHEVGLVIISYVIQAHRLLFYTCFYLCFYVCVPHSYLLLILLITIILIIVIIVIIIIVIIIVIIIIRCTMEMCVFALWIWIQTMTWNTPWWKAYCLAPPTRLC